MSTNAGEVQMFCNNIFFSHGLNLMAVIFFTSKVSEALRFYVYAYIDPVDQTIFYIGKGNKNRCFDHLKKNGESEKYKRIKKIRETGLQPRIDILAFNLDEEQALSVESAAIDLIGFNNLANLQKGHDSSTYGRRTVDDVYAQFSGMEVADFKEDMVLIRINQRYDPKFDDMQLYEATRGIWEIAEKKRDTVTHACALYKGVIREVYEIASWHPAGSTMYSTRPTDDFQQSGRFEFVGKIAGPNVLKRYKNHTVNERFFPFGFAGSTRFVGPSFSINND